MTRSIDPTLGPAIVREATKLGISPKDLATAIGYETVGTYSPDIRGGAGNHYYGLIQFGPAEQKHYGIVPGMTADEQMVKVGDYLRDRKLQPGSGLLDIYSTINAGSPGHYGRADASGKTVRQHVAEMQRSYGPRSGQIVGGVDAQPAVAASGRTMYVMGGLEKVEGGKKDEINAALMAKAASLGYTPVLVNVPGEDRANQTAQLAALLQANPGSGVMAYSAAAFALRDGIKSGAIDPASISQAEVYGAPDMVNAESQLSGIQNLNLVPTLPGVGHLDLPQAIASQSAAPAGGDTLASLDMGGIPGKFVTDTQAAQPVTAAVLAARIPDDARVPGGMAPVINAIAAGDAAATKAAWQQNTEFTKDPTGTLNWLKTEFPKQFPAVERAAAEKWHVVKAAFSPMAQGAVEGAFKSAPPAPPVTASVAPISFPASLPNGGWGRAISDTLTRDVPGSLIPEAQSEISRSPPIFTGFDAKSGAGSLFGGGGRKTGGASDGAGVPWFNATPALSQSESSSRTLPSRSYDVPSYADPAGLPTQPTSPYGKPPPAAGGPAMGGYAPSSLAGALAKLSPAVGGPAMGGYVPPAAALPLTAGADPVATPLAGVSYLPSEADPKPAYTMAPKPQAPVRQISYRGGPVAGARLPVAGQGSMGGGGLGAFAPTIASVISAARGAGYTTGVASPGYTSSPAYQAAMSHGYSAPNFSKGSGGAIYAYHPDGNGGGTYVNSFGKTMTY